MTGTKTGVVALVFAGELGRGHFGRVLEANVAPQGTVAVKVIDCEAMKDMLGVDSWSELKEHLFAEAINLSKAAHPNVVAVHAVQHSPNKTEVYIVTERCDGSLAKLAANGPVPLAIASVAIRHALMGLEALHLRGMVHRDLKPANVLRKDATFKLADFGLVTDDVVKGYASRQGYTEHLAPEAFEVDATSSSTDVWALGMTAFRVLNGEPWYAELRAKLGVDPLDPVAAAAVVEDLVTSGGFTKRLRWMPHVPSKWRRFVNKALSYSPATRYRDGGAALSGLNRLQAPDAPSWDCDYSTAFVRWTRSREGREEVIEWDRTAATAYVAFTRSTDGSGQNKTLKRSTTGAKKNDVFRELQEFFETRNE